MAGSPQEVDLDAGPLVGYLSARCPPRGDKPGRAMRSCEAPGLLVETPADARIRAEPYDSEDGSRPEFEGGDFLSDYESTYRLEVPSPGAYRVTLASTPDPGAKLAIGPSGSSRRTLGVILAAGGLVLAAAALLIIAAWGISLMLYQATKNG